MRTALLLLLLLALASVPGSLLPQRSVDPTAVDIFIARHRKWGPFLDRLSGYDVFGAPWFAAIYALLFTSLIGCLIPRVRLHARALLRKPIKAPAHPARLATGARFETDAAASVVVDAGRKALRSRHFRVAYDTNTLSAEKGYLRETGNLIFHVSLVGLLAGIAVGGLFGYTGKVLITEGSGFSNTLVQYDNFSRGALVNPDKLQPFGFKLRDFSAQYQANGQPKLYRAVVSLNQSTSNAATGNRVIEVNTPLKVGNSTKLYLINYGYAPRVVLRDASGQPRFDGYVPCVATDVATMTSTCKIKIPDTGLPPVGPLKTPQQLGISAGFVPTFDTDNTAGSIYPAMLNPRLAGVQVWLGNLGVDGGTSQNVYVLDTSRMTQLIVRGSNNTQPPIVDPTDANANSILGLPGGLRLSFEGVRQYAVFSVKHDPGKMLVFWASVLMLFGLSCSLLVRRRRLWIRTFPADNTGRTVVEIGGLSRTGDFAPEFAEHVRRLNRQLAARNS